MRKNVCLTTVLVILLFAVFLATSCAKKEIVQTQPVETIQAEAPMAPDRSAEQTEQSKRPQEDRIMASDRSAEQAEQARRLQEDRLRAEAAAREADRTVFVNENIHFAFDSSVLSDRAKQMLNNKADYLRTNPGVTVTVEGHCDERGPDIYNTVLGERRAESVKNFLVNNLGISANRLNTISYGEKQPIAMGQTEDSWAKNRRAQFVIN